MKKRDLSSMLIKEYHELDQKISKLKVSLSFTKPGDIIGGTEMLAKMEKQLDAMVLYAQQLKERIDILAKDGVKCE